MNSRPCPVDPPALRLQRWMRIVGGFYVLMGLFNTPPVIVARFPVQYPDIGVTVDSMPAQALVDVWFRFGLEVAVIGGALLNRSPQPGPPPRTGVDGAGTRGRPRHRRRAAPARSGYEVTPYVVWIVVHAIIIATGLRALRHAQLLPRGNTRRDPAKVDA